MGELRLRPWETSQHRKTGAPQLFEQGLDVFQGIVSLEVTT